MFPRFLGTIDPVIPDFHFSCSPQSFKQGYSETSLIKVDLEYFQNQS